MERIMEDKEYNYRDVTLPTFVPIVSEPELERETGERRRGRDIVIAVDHGPNSKHAFDWALIHLARLADTIHLVHVVSSVRNEIVYETSQGLLEKLAAEAFEVAMVRTTARIVEGDAGKIICKESERLKPAAVVLGTRGRSLIRRFFPPPFPHATSFYVDACAFVTIPFCKMSKGSPSRFLALLSSLLYSCRVLQGSVSEYCFHNCKSAPVIIVPAKEAGDESLI